MDHSTVCGPKKMKTYMVATALVLRSKELDFRRASWLDLKESRIIIIIKKRTRSI